MAIGVKVDGLMLLVIAGVVAGSVVYAKRKKIIESIDPTSEKNLAYQGASGFVKGASAGKYKNVADWTWQTRKYNPLAWAFEGIAKLTGDLP